MSETPVENTVEVTVTNNAQINDLKAANAALKHEVIALARRDAEEGI